MNKQLKPNGVFILNQDKVEDFLNADASAKKLLERFYKHKQNTKGSNENNK